MSVIHAVVVAQADAGSGNPLGFLIPLVVLGGLFYVFLVLPQRRRVKQLENLRSSLSVGDEVRTVGGIFGRIVDDDEEAFTIDTGGGTRLRVAKRAIAEKIERDT